MCWSQEAVALSFFIVNALVMTIEATSSMKINRTGSGSATTETSLLKPQPNPNNSCSISSFGVCLAKIKEVSEDSNLAFASNKADLDLACMKLKEGDTCAENHMRNCTSTSQKRLFQEIVRGTKQVLKSLCQSGEVQNNYLRFASCYKNVSMSDNKCAPVLKKVQSISTTVQSGENVEQGLKKFCCAFKESVNCQINFVGKDCGEKAVTFFNKYLSEISYSLMHQHCATYTYSDSCNKTQMALSESVMPHSSSQMMIILFILFTTAYQHFIYYNRWCNYLVSIIL